MALKAAHMLFPITMARAGLYAHDFYRAALLSMGLGCLQVLTGCSLTPERTELAPKVPPAYGVPADVRDRAPPTLDWSRGFRSPELTALIETAQTDNLDIAAAIGRLE